MKQTFERVNRAALDKVRAVCADGDLYMAVPLDGAAENTHVIVYSPGNDCWNLMELAVSDFTVFEGKTMCVCGGSIYLFSDGDSFGGNAIHARYTFPIRAEAGKRLFTRRFLFPVVMAEEGCLKITVKGDDITLSRIVALPQGKSMACIRLGVQGRLIEFGIENVLGCGFELPDGIKVEFGMTEG